MIVRIIKLTLIAALMTAVGLRAFYTDLNVAGLILGAAWGCLNLYLIKVLLESLLIQKNIALASALILIKFPLLYGLGYILLTASQVNPWLAIVGLSLIFLAALAAIAIPKKRLS